MLPRLTDPKTGFEKPFYLFLQPEDLANFLDLPPAERTAQQDVYFKRATTALAEERASRKAEKPVSPKVSGSAPASPVVASQPSQSLGTASLVESARTLAEVNARIGTFVGGEGGSGRSDSPAPAPAAPQPFFKQPTDRASQGAAPHQPRRMQVRRHPQAPAAAGARENALARLDQLADRVEAFVAAREEAAGFRRPQSKKRATPDSARPTDGEAAPKSAAGTPATDPQAANGAPVRRSGRGASK